MSSKIICSTASPADSSHTVVNVTSRINSPLSPFTLQTPFGLMENVWQFSKVYKQHIDSDGKIKDEWYKWRDKGLKMSRAIRHPFEVKVQEEFLMWENEKLTKAQARRKIYIPLYTSAILETQKDAFLDLVEKYKECCTKGSDLYLIEFDAYNRHKLDWTLDQVIDYEGQSMGHSFVLEKMILEHLGRATSSTKNKFF